MTAVTPLFEFMPYGAPELIASQRTHQTRALSIASGAAIAVFAIAGVLAPAIPRPKPADVSVIIDATVLHPVPPLPPGPMPRLRETPRAEPRPAPDPGSIPVPVPDFVDPPLAQDDMGQTNGVQNGAPARAGVIGQESNAVDEAPPKWGDPLPEVLPQAIVIIKPKYPDMPKDLGIEGSVYVRMLVGKDGRVMRAEIDPKFSVPMLDESALVAARQWVFTPAKSGGHPVPVWVGEMFTYRIQQ